MTSCFYKKGDAKTLRVGATLPMPEEEIFQNNSKRIRECYVRRVRPSAEGDETKVLYISPTNREVECIGRIDARIFLENDGVDWSGLDGFLKFD